MAFTYDPATSRGKVRLLVADTDTGTSANQIFTDAEIDAFLSLEGEEVYMAAAAACRSLAASTSKSAIAWRALDQSIDRSRIPQYYRELAMAYIERAQKGEPVEYVDTFDMQFDKFGKDESEYPGDVVS